MSIERIAAVWAHSKQRSGGLVVMLAIADFTNKSFGFAWPSLPLLAKHSRMTVRNVQRWLTQLQADGELEVYPNRGAKGTNHFVIKLPPAPKTGAPQNGDTDVAVGVTLASRSGDADVAQSVIDPINEPAPIVPKGDENVLFWVKTCFDCFNTPRRPIPDRLARALARCVARLDRSHAHSLVRFYTFADLDDKAAGYSSRVHSPERLMLRLEQQLGLAVRFHPPPPKREHTLEQIRDWMQRNYQEGCFLPTSLEQFYQSGRIPADVRAQVEAGIRREKSGA